MVVALVVIALFGGCVLTMQAFAGRHLALLETWSGAVWWFELIATALSLAGLSMAVPWGIVLAELRRRQVLQAAHVVLFVAVLLVLSLAFVASLALLPPRGGCPPDETSFPCVFLARHADVPVGWVIGLVVGILIGPLMARAVSRKGRGILASIRRDSSRHQWTDFD